MGNICVKQNIKKFDIENIDRSKIDIDIDIDMLININDFTQLRNQIKNKILFDQVNQIVNMTETLLLDLKHLELEGQDKNVSQIIKKMREIWKKIKYIFKLIKQKSKCIKQEYISVPSPVPNYSFNEFLNKTTSDLIIQLQKQIDNIWFKLIQINKILFKNNLNNIHRKDQNYFKLIRTQKTIHRNIEQWIIIQCILKQKNSMNFIEFDPKQNIFCLANTLKSQISEVVKIQSGNKLITLNKIDDKNKYKKQIKLESKLIDITSIIKKKKQYRQINYINLTIQGKIQKSDKDLVRKIQQEKNIKILEGQICMLKKEVLRLQNENEDKVHKNQKLDINMKEINQSNKEKIKNLEVSIEEKTIKQAELLNQCKILKSTLKVQEQRINQLNEELQLTIRIEQHNSVLSQRNEQYSRHLCQLQRQIIKLQNENANLASLNKQIQNIQFINTFNSCKRIEFQSLASVKIQDYQRQLQQLKNHNCYILDECQSLKKQNQLAKSQIAQLESSLRKVTNENLQLNHLKLLQDEKASEIKILKNQLQKSQFEKNAKEKLRLDVQKLQFDMDKVMSQNSSLTIIIYELEQKISNLEDQLSNMGHLNEQLTEIKEQNQNMRLIIQNLKNQNIELNQQISQFRDKLQDANQQIEISKKNIQEEVIQLQEKQQRCSGLQLENEKLKQQITQYKSTCDILYKKSRKYDELFKNSEIIQSYEHEKLLLSLFFCQIAIFKLLYRASESSFKQFHEHCDMKKNILVIALSQNLSIFGGYSCIAINQELQQIDQQRQSFLFKIKGEEYQRFAIKENRCPVMYDMDSGPIFGLSEIRIKGKQCTLNFGLPNGNYIKDLSTDNSTIFDLTVRLKEYEVYEILFK